MEIAAISFCSYNKAGVSRTSEVKHIGLQPHIDNSPGDARYRDCLVLTVAIRRSRCCKGNDHKKRLSSEIKPSRPLGNLVHCERAKKRR